MYTIRFTPSFTPSLDKARHGWTIHPKLVGDFLGHYNGTMNDWEQFLHAVHTAFARLDDRPGLTMHPLASLLAKPGEAASPEALRRVLLGAIDEVRPPDGSPPHSASWRRWRCLVLRYAEGATTKQIAQQLQISPRQALRDNLAGLDAVATVLWSRYGPTVPLDGALIGEGSISVEAPPIRSPHSGGLEADLGRVSASSPRESANLAEVLEGALVTIQGLAQERRARFSVLITDDIRPVSCDPVVLRQILLCVAMASSQRHPSAQVEISASQDSSSVLLHLDPQDKPTAGRARLVAIEDADTLINTARRLVDAEGGGLRVETRSDGGERITLAFRPAPLATILVVDDNPDVVDLFRCYLDSARYQLIQARTPRTALSLARSLQPDVITLDVMMPSKDGWQILQELREIPSVCDIPVIVCSVLAEQPIARSFGVTDFLAKPVTPQALRSALHRCLSGRKVEGRPDSGEGRPLPHRL